MGNITYEQFEAWCKHWNYTIDEGFQAMCFSANIIGQHYGNCLDCVKEIKSNHHSDAFKDIVNKNFKDAIILSDLYNMLDRQVFIVLEQHEKGA